jgi:hypothetical protein
MTVAVAFCTLLAVSALWQHSRRDALLLATTVLAAMLAAWILCGQQVTDLPRYFLAQPDIVWGYTDAMSLAGPREEVWVFLAVAALLVWAVWTAAGRAGWRTILATAAFLFLCFKAGFVRHDAHALIAASALLVVGSVAVLLWPSVPRVVGFAVALAGWAAIAGSYEPARPLEVASRFTGAVSKSIDGVQIRVFHGDWLPAWFQTANQGISRRQPLPVTSGTADLYLAELSVLLANGANWSPRPVLQSYSAYTAGLATLNEEHVRLAGADRVYFGPGSVDDRHPALDDGSSWPVLLANYDPVGFAGPYAVLDRRARPSKVEVGQLLFAGRAMVGTQVPIPAAAAVWAQIDIEPTMLGKLASLVFKRPALAIEVRYASGRTRTYRFIPALGKRGFLLTPTVSASRDFVALQSAQADVLLSGKRPISFRLLDASSKHFWEQSFNVRLSPLRIEPAPWADQALAGVDPGTAASR